jgi:hypothetical protein
MSRDGAIRFADARTGAGALSSSAAQLTENLSYKEKIVVVAGFPDWNEETRFFCRRRGGSVWGFDLARRAINFVRVVVIFLGRFRYFKASHVDKISLN